MFCIVLSCFIMFYPLSILGHPWASLGHLGLRGISGHHASEGPEAKAARFAELKWASQSAWYLIRTPHSQLSNLSSISIESRLCMSFVIFCLHVLYIVLTPGGSIWTPRFRVNLSLRWLYSAQAPGQVDGQKMAKTCKHVQSKIQPDTAWYSKNRERIRMDKNG